MAKPRLAILDACTVIDLHQLGLWNLVASRYEVLVTETVAAEADYFVENGITFPINLGASAAVVSIGAGAVARLRARFRPFYREMIHDGEAESLALLQERPDAVICSSDAIVFKALGALNDGDKCVSLQSLMKQIGERFVPRDYLHTDEFCARYVKEGSIDMQQGRALF